MTRTANLPTYDEAIQFLLERINYERTVSVPYDRRAFRLEQMRELLERLENPQAAFPIVHVAGTKGKGSTAAMVASILSAAGHRTALYSSPHFERLEERVAIDGEPCTHEELVAVVARLRPVIADMDRRAAEGGNPGPTFFDALTAAAFLHFAARKVDAAVVEVGLGGRLDSTNACQPRVSTIVSISFDHTKQLGSTLAEIAREKAGIIKPGVPVISGVQNPEAQAIIRHVAAENSSPLVELGRDFDYRYAPPEHLERRHDDGRMSFEHQKSGAARSLDALKLGLLGRHQAANAAVALAVCRELEAQGWQLPEGAVRSGLAEVRLPARVEVISRRPAVVLDAAHNLASIAALLEVLDESFAAQPRLLVFATTQEKDVAGMLRLLVPRFGEIIFTRYLNNPRAIDPHELGQAAAALGAARYHVEPTPEAAWACASAAAGPDHLVAITGSFFIAAEMRAAIERAHALTP